ncbi:MAG TPA: hypothetical protein VHW64_16735 [Nocardioides sp.]|jgi:hypothetical protein|uniref:SCO7613 C-terminal domain-containing membrane protein n=1 Tax=Nocardioides sp. TaxID=35761 RepID=UPI002E33F7D2|nr:hypothetical protein [Nocardioides sp.]HEX3932345.1 hypothetical protein [Nocardioides sp.]
MTTYADPTRCPDCRAALPRDPQACPVCSLPLTGETAVSLFSTFQEADRLVGLLRLARQVAPVPATAAAAPGARTGSHLSGVDAYPAPAPRRTGRPPKRRLRGASVPKILLSLGALCLLVAAVTFLAVAWAWLGVGGRTAVLVALTGTALGLATTFHRRGLRMAAESLSAVGLGLLALDVVGVRRAGWVRPLDGAHLTLLIGAVVATGALLLLALTSRRPLASPALISPAALLVAGLGAQLDVDPLVPLVVTVALLLCLGRLGTELPSVALRIASLAAAGLGWSALVLAAVAVAWSWGTTVTVAHYAGDLAGWPMLAATGLAAVAGPVVGARRGVRLGGYAAAGLTGSYTVLMPVLDNEPTAMMAAVLAVSAVWVAALLVASPGLRPAAVLPLVGTLVVPLAAAGRLTRRAAHAALSVGAPFSQPFDVHVSAVHLWVSPLLLVPTLVTSAAGGLAVVTLVRPLGRSTWAIAVLGAAVLGGLVTLPLYDVPLALPVGLAVVLALAALAIAERRRGGVADTARLGALALTAGATLVALPSDRLTTAVLAVSCAMAGALMLRSGTTTTGAVASLCFPAAFAGLVWAGGSATGVHPDLRAVPVLLVLGALAIRRPQPELETASALAGLLASAAAIAAARDLDVALAVHLTIAGALVTATSLLHPGRRLLSWPGGLLLAAATWVRLYELGVHAPEAYTLPSAAVLVAVGCWRLRDDDRSATLTCLAPGLMLATVPSLLASLHDPYSLRALLLGLACLVLTVGGSTLRWSAPLVVGAGVAALLVLRELAPYAAQVPSWLTIGVSGALLLVVGITWEHRMNDVRSASRYVAALR